MILEILTLGNELLDGRRVDTNTAWIGRQCSLLGLCPRYSQSVSDDVDDICAAMTLALKRSDIVLCTGGLGPTMDDLTFEALAKTLDQDLVFHPDIFSQIEKKYAARGIPCPASNKRQAYLPAGAMILSNPLGTAPGAWVTEKGKQLFCMPGVPSEMKHMFETHVVPKMVSWLGDQPQSVQRTYRFSGLAEALVEESIVQVDLSTLPLNRVEIAYTASFPEVHVTYTLWPQISSSVDSIFGALDERISQKLSDYWIGLNDLDLVEKVVSRLREKKWTISMAESITGGSLASRFVDVAGVSEVFDQSWVTYSNRSKIDQLGVVEQTLQDHGAVSEACALEMAMGAKARAKATIGVGITGIAGPGGETPDKPKGLTYIAWVGPEDQTMVKEFRFTLDRNRNRMLATNHAVIGIARLIKESLVCRSAK
ncbi:MAG: CinA family nicotinamide mononucleotide deamidase-related protein [Bdellovibrionota bacterium]